MSMVPKIRNTIKQFGYAYIFKAIIKKMASPIVKWTSFYVLAIKNHNPHEIIEDYIVLNLENLNDFLNRETNIDNQLERQLNKFLANNCVAIVIYVNKRIAGWGFVQLKGKSNYAQYVYEVKERTHLLKNLYVLPDFRGQSIGKRINNIRINYIPKGYIPVVFVIPSNRYAIRNLELYGFEKHIFVKDFVWFRRFKSKQIKLLKKNDISELIKEGFEL